MHRTVLRVLLTALWVLSSFTSRASAKAVCHTDAQGNEQCKEMLSPGIIAAIVVSAVVFVGILLGVFFYIRRMRAKKEAAALESTFSVEPAQIRGPPVMARAHTTYDNPATFGGTANSRSHLMSGSGYYASGSGNYATGSELATSRSKRLAAMTGAGSAPMLPPLNLGGPSSGMDHPSTAPSNKASYPFTGISSSKLPPMPVPASAYVRSGPAFGYGYV
jgi:hypothetical protein